MDVSGHKWKFTPEIHVIIKNKEIKILFILYSYLLDTIYVYIYTLYVDFGAKYVMDYFGLFGNYV